MSRLNIAIISVHGGPLQRIGSEGAGGQNVYVRELARALGSMGHGVHVFTRNTRASSVEVVDTSWGQVFRIPAGPPSYIHREALYHALPEFYEYLSNFQGYDVIHSNYWLSGWVGLAYRKQFGIPLVHTSHSLGAAKMIASRFTYEPGVRHRVELEIVRQADELILTTPAEMNLLENHYHCLPKQATIVPCGFRASCFWPRDQAQSRHRLGLPSECPIVIYAGRFAQMKGIQLLLEAMVEVTKHTPCHLVLAGGFESDVRETADSQSAYMKVHQLGLAQATTFLGKVSHQNLAHAYSASDLCVVPSFYESFGLVAVEAQACGIPVVASNVGGLKEVVKHGVGGLLFPVGDKDALAKSILHLLENSSYRRKLGAQAAEFVAPFTWSQVSREIEQVYVKVCQRRGCTKS